MARSGKAGRPSRRAETILALAATRVQNFVQTRMKGVAGYITPVPGGVGPMTITMLVANTVRAAKRLSGFSKQRVSDFGDGSRSKCSVFKNKVGVDAVGSHKRNDRFVQNRTVEYFLHSRRSITLLVS